MVDEKPLTGNQQRILAQAAEQAKRQSVMRRKNIIVFSGLLAAVAGIYTYSIFSVKQEKLDFD